MQLAFWAASLAAGVLTGIVAESVFSWVFAGIALAASTACLWLRARNLGLASFAIVLGIWLGHREAALARAPARVAEDQPVDIVGQIAAGADIADQPATIGAENSEGRIADKKPNTGVRCHLRLDVQSVDDKEVLAKLSLLVLDGVPDFAPGDWVRFSSRLYVPRGFANPGMPDARLLARSQGIDLLATVRTPSELHRISGPTSLLCYARRMAFHLRRAMSRAINRRLAEPAAGFVRTMVVGERTDVPAEVEDGFRAAGATHVLSVSGLHLAVVVALVFHALMRIVACFPGWALRVPPKVVASVLSLPACGFYTLLTGEAVATVRSALMASMVLGAAVVNRPVSLSASIAAAAIVLLVQSPLAILDVSFQLSFASVMGLGLFANWLLLRAPAATSGRSNRVLAWLLRSLSASFAASLVTAPLVAHHFGEVTPAAPIGNLVLVPVVELVVLPCGLVGSLLALAHPWLGALPLMLAGVASRLAIVAAGIFRRFAPVALVRYPDWCETLLLVAAAALVLQALAGSTNRRRRWLAAGAAALILAGTSLAVREAVRRTRDGLRVTFLDVGQGDSALIEGPRGFVALVDGGGRYDDSFDTGARIVEPVLRARGITALDLVILSHPHPDHMNGLLRILQRFSVGALWTSGDDGNNPVYRTLMALAHEHHVATPPPTQLVRDGLIVTPLGPWFDGRIGVPPGLGTNDASLVVRLSYSGQRMLLAGDIGEEGEAELLDGRSAGTDLGCDVLKMPHHGSRHASGDGFLDAVSPRLAVASAGKFNRFGLPSPAALNRYARRDISVLRTDRDGAVSLTVDASGNLRAACSRGCQPSIELQAPRAAGWPH
jgi:competence protein ComEC